MENSVVIIEIVRNIHANNDFLKKSFVSINDASSEELIEQVKQQYRLSAAADASDYFDFAVPHMMNHTIQIKISFNHYSHLVLATIASLLSCIVYHEFLKLLMI